MALEALSSIGAELQLEKREYENGSSGKALASPFLCQCISTELIYPSMGLMFSHCGGCLYLGEP